MCGLVLFAHGARDPEWARPFEAIRDRIRAQRPELPIELAFLEVMTPALDEAIASVAARGASCVTVFPLFMAQGGHLKQDLPRILDDIRAAVDIVGVHYPCGYKKPALTCDSTANAIKTGKPLWASENGSLDVDGGAAALIRPEAEDLFR